MAGAQFGRAPAPASSGWDRRPPACRARGPPRPSGAPPGDGRNADDSKAACGPGAGRRGSGRGSRTGRGRCTAGRGKRPGGRGPGAGTPGPIAGSYLVLLTPQAAKSDAGQGTSLTAHYGGKVRRSFDAALHGFSVELSERQAPLAADPAVAEVVQNRRVSPDGSQPAPLSWGLDRIGPAASADDRPLRLPGHRRTGCDGVRRRQRCADQPRGVRRPGVHTVFGVDASARTANGVWRLRVAGGSEYFAGLISTAGPCSSESRGPLPPGPAPGGSGPRRGLPAELGGEQRAHPGPGVIGRGLVVQPAPGEEEGVPRARVDDRLVAHPGRRQRVVDPAALTSAWMTWSSSAKNSSIRTSRSAMAPVSRSSDSGRLSGARHRQPAG